MVNSNSFDRDRDRATGQGDRNAKAGCTQPHDASDTSTQSSSPVTASGVASCDSGLSSSSRTADSDLPSDAATAYPIGPTPTKTEINSAMPLKNNSEGSFSSVEERLVDNETSPSAVSLCDEKTSLCCSLPLDKVQGVLTPYHQHKGEEDAVKPTKPTRKLLCLYCDRSFVSANLRQKHVARIHSVKQSRRVSSRRQNQLTVTPCVYCDKLNSTENTLKDLFYHLVNEHPNKYFGCLPCEDRFLTSSLLADHIDSKHPQKKNIEASTINIASTSKSPTPEAEESAPQEVHQGEDIPVKLTRSRVKPKCEDSPNTDESGQDKKILVRKKTAKLKELRNKKLSIKSSRIALKRRESKRLQALAKLADSQKKKRVKTIEKKALSITPKTEQINSTKSVEKPKSTSSCINPYPEFDCFYRVKKITDHSIDNLKISSLTFDDVFDKAFFNRIKCNIEENLLHHIDGKLFENEESENRISNFEKVSNTPQENQNTSSENYGCEISLNAVTPIASLSLNSQFGEDFESQIEYGSKPSKKKAQTKSDEVHYKYFTRRKFQASILEHKENRDLSKLDMWTQLVIKKRQQKMLDQKKTAKEIQEYTSGDEYKNKLKREELNRILDRRGPFEDLKEEASKKAALDKLNSSEDKISPESFVEVREILNEVLNRVFATTDSYENNFEEDAEQSFDKKQDLREIPDYLNLLRSSSLPSEGEIDQSDKITLICSSQETENFELPTNQARGKNEVVELSGEWARCRMYICAACSAKLPNMKYLLEHKNIYHQNIWVQHYEFVGNQSELYRHLSIPSLGKVGAIEESVPCKAWRRSEARLCTKCGKQCNTLGELHRHVLECGGDWTWMLARKKCKYRPFGAKSRRKRRGLVHRIHVKRKTEPTEKKKKKKYKKTFEGPRQRPSDADTIQRMLANLPAKRSTRKLISLQEGIYRARKKTQLKSNLNKTKVKCGKVIYKSSNIKENTEKTINTTRVKVTNLPQKSYPLTTRRALRSISKVLSSRILDTNAKLTVRRKLKVINERRKTRQSLLEANVEENEKKTPSEVKHQKTKSKTTLKYTTAELIPTKRTSPRSSPKNLKNMTVKKLLTGKINMKSFFPVKKLKNKNVTASVQHNQEENQNEETGDVKTRSKRKSKEVEEATTDKSTSSDLKENSVKAEPKKTKNDTFCKLVRSLSFNKKKALKKSNSPSLLHKNTKSETISEEQVNKLDTDSSSTTNNVNESPENNIRKRKVKQNFKNMINKVKKLKIDRKISETSLAEPKSSNIGKRQSTEDAFLDKSNKQNDKLDPPTEPEKIVIPSTSEAKENIADISEAVPIVLKFNETNKDIQVPETIFKLESNNEKSLQAKGELDFDSKPPNKKSDFENNKSDTIVQNKESVAETIAEEVLPEKLEPISIETSVKPKVVPLVSPNIKGKIRKPTRGLNDCIAMLTSKLQQKSSESCSKSDIVLDLSPSSNIIRPIPDIILSKPDCILKIPTFKTHHTEVEETALDLSMKSKSNPELNRIQYVDIFQKKRLSVFNRENIFCDARWTLYPSKFMSSLDQTIEDVVGNRTVQVIPMKKPNLWNSVDDTIQKVIDEYRETLTHTVRAQKFARNSVDDIIESVITNSTNYTNDEKIVLEEKLLGNLLSNKSTILKSSMNKTVLESEMKNDFLLSQKSVLDIGNIADDNSLNQLIHLHNAFNIIRKGSVKKRGRTRKTQQSSLTPDVLKDLDETKMVDHSKVSTTDSKTENMQKTRSQNSLENCETSIPNSDQNTEYCTKESPNDPETQETLKINEIKSKSRKIGKSKKEAATKKKPKVKSVLETNVDDLLHYEEIKKPEMSTVENTNDSHEQEIKLSNEDEPGLLENKILVQDKNNPVCSDSEDDIPLAVLVKPDEKTNDSEKENTIMSNKPNEKQKCLGSQERSDKNETSKVLSRRSKSPRKKIKNDTKNAVSEPTKPDSIEIVPKISATEETNPGPGHNENPELQLKSESLAEANTSNNTGDRLSAESGCCSSTKLNKELVQDENVDSESCIFTKLNKELAEKEKSAEVYLSEDLENTICTNIDNYKGTSLDDEHSLEIDSVPSGNKFCGGPKNSSSKGSAKNGRISRSETLKKKKNQLLKKDSEEYLENQGTPNNKDTLEDNSKTGKKFLVFSESQQIFDISSKCPTTDSTYTVVPEESKLVSDASAKREDIFKTPLKGVKKSRKGGRRKANLKSTKPILRRSKSFGDAPSLETLDFEASLSNSSDSTDSSDKPLERSHSLEKICSSVTDESNTNTCLNSSENTCEDNMETFMNDHTNNTKLEVEKTHEVILKQSLEVPDLQMSTLRKVRKRSSSLNPKGAIKSNESPDIRNITVKIDFMESEICCKLQGKIHTDDVESEGNGTYNTRKDKSNLSAVDAEMDATNESSLNEIGREDSSLCFSVPLLIAHQRNETIKRCRSVAGINSVSNEPTSNLSATDDAKVISRQYEERSDSEISSDVSQPSSIKVKCKKRRGRKPKLSKIEFNQSDNDTALMSVDSLIKSVASNNVSEEVSVNNSFIEDTDACKPTEEKNIFIEVPDTESKIMPDNTDNKIIDSTYVEISTVPIEVNPKSVEETPKFRKGKALVTEGKIEIITQSCPDNNMSVSKETSNINSSLDKSVNEMITVPLPVPKRTRKSVSRKSKPKEKIEIEPENSDLTVAKPKFKEGKAAGESEVTSNELTQNLENRAVVAESKSSEKDNIDSSASNVKSIRVRLLGETEFFSNESEVKSINEKPLSSEVPVSQPLETVNCQGLKTNKKTKRSKSAGRKLHMNRTAKTLPHGIIDSQETTELTQENLLVTPVDMEKLESSERVIDPNTKRTLEVATTPDIGSLNPKLLENLNNKVRRASRKTKSAKHEDSMGKTLHQTEPAEALEENEKSIETNTVAANVDSSKISETSELVERSSVAEDNQPVLQLNINPPASKSLKSVKKLKGSKSLCRKNHSEEILHEEIHPVKDVCKDVLLEPEEKTQVSKVTENFVELDNDKLNENSVMCELENSGHFKATTSFAETETSLGVSDKKSDSVTKIKSSLGKVHDIDNPVGEKTLTEELLLVDPLILENRMPDHRNGEIVTRSLTEELDHITKLEVIKPKQNQSKIIKRTKPYKRGKKIRNKNKVSEIRLVEVKECNPNVGQTDNELQADITLKEMSMNLKLMEQSTPLQSNNITKTNNKIFSTPLTFIEPKSHIKTRKPVRKSKASKRRKFTTSKICPVTDVSSYELSISGENITLHDTGIVTGQVSKVGNETAAVIKNHQNTNQDKADIMLELSQQPSTEHKETKCLKELHGSTSDNEVLTAWPDLNTENITGETLELGSPSLPSDESNISVESSNSDCPLKLIIQAKKLKSGKQKKSNKINKPSPLEHLPLDQKYVAGFETLYLDDKNSEPLKRSRSSKRLSQMNDRSLEVLETSADNDASTDDSTQNTNKYKKQKSLRANNKLSKRADEIDEPDIKLKSLKNSNKVIQRRKSRSSRRQENAGTSEVYESAEVKDVEISAAKDVSMGQSEKGKCRSTTNSINPELSLELTPEKIDSENNQANSAESGAGITQENSKRSRSARNKTKVRYTESDDKEILDEGSSTEIADHNIEESKLEQSKHMPNKSGEDKASDLQESKHTKIRGRRKSIKIGGTPVEPPGTSKEEILDINHAIDNVINSADTQLIENPSSDNSKGDISKLKTDVALPSTTTEKCDKSQLDNKNGHTIHEPIKLIINTQKTRRKSKSFKKNDLKGQDDLFKDFALVIKKPKRIAPHIAFINHNVFQKDIHNYMKQPSESFPSAPSPKILEEKSKLEEDLDVSVEEMDMELDEIPITSNIIVRSTLDVTDVPDPVIIGNTPEVLDKFTKISSKTQNKQIKKAKKCLKNRKVKKVVCRVADESLDCKHLEDSAARSQCNDKGNITAEVIDAQETGLIEPTKETNVKLSEDVIIKENTLNALEQQKLNEDHVPNVNESSLLQLKDVSFPPPTNIYSDILVDDLRSAEPMDTSSEVVLSNKNTEVSKSSCKARRNKTARNKLIVSKEDILKSSKTESEETETSILKDNEETVSMSITVRNSDNLNINDNPNAKCIESIYTFSESEDFEIEEPVKISKRLPRKQHSISSESRRIRDKKECVEHVKIDIPTEEQTIKIEIKPKKESHTKSVTRRRPKTHKELVDTVQQGFKDYTIKEDNAESEDIGRRKSARTAKVKALEHIQGEALAELTDGGKNMDLSESKTSQIDEGNEANIEKIEIKNSKKTQKKMPEVDIFDFPHKILDDDDKAPLFAELVADLAGLEELENSIERELNAEMNDKLEAFGDFEPTDGDMEISDRQMCDDSVDERLNQESQNRRRSRRGSRKITSYNENDLIGPILDIIDGKKKNKKKDVTDKVVATENKASRKSKELDKKLNSDELFDRLKSSTNDTVSKPQNSFLDKFKNTLKSDTKDVFNVATEKSASLQENTDDDKNPENAHEFSENLNSTEKLETVSISDKKKNKKVLKRNSSPVKPSMDENSDSTLKMQDLTMPFATDLQNTADSTKSFRNETNYCEICNKSFIRVENLIKHKRTLTHIQKLSEIEAKEANKEISKLEQVSNEASQCDSVPHLPPDLPKGAIDCCQSDINIHNILLKSEKPGIHSQVVHSSFADNDSLQLADIISDVLNKPVLHSNSNNIIDSEEHNKFTNNQNNEIQREFRRYKSLGERKSFDSDTILMPENHVLPITDPYISKTTILEKQISLLENIIENQTGMNYVDDISISSNNSLIENSEFNSKFNQDDSSNVTSKHNKKIASNDDSFLKPSQYEEVSEDSANLRNYEDQKKRKALNRDEELFLECCSLLKSGSEVSSYSNQRSQKVSNSLEVKEHDGSESTDEKKLAQKQGYDLHDNYSGNNSRIPTPLGDSFDDDASDSNTISSNWDVNRMEPVFEDQQDNINFNLTFEKVLNTTIQDKKKGENITKGSNSKSLDEEVTDNNPEKDKPGLGECKKIITKGARKVFEGLKVSIPTEELNLEEVLNCSPKSKKQKNVLHSQSSTVTEAENTLLPLKPTRTGRKSKPVKKSQVGINLLFKMNKKKVSPTVSPITKKEENEKMKSYDVYDFEETQDNTDVFPKPSDFRSFRNKKNGDDEPESDTESRDDYSFAIEPSESITSSVSSSTSLKKPKAQENITKKKCMIMGRIFKNQAKYKLEDIDEEMREIPIIDNDELVENYVANCKKIIKNEIKPKLSEKEINQLFDQLLENKNTETGSANSTHTKTTAKSKTDSRKVDKKKQNKIKSRKRARTNSESTDDEFSISKSSKRSYKKGGKPEDNSINLEQELKECIGVASRKSQRKCTSGKQNVLVEYWSSDDSQFEALLESQRIDIKPKEVEAVAEKIEENQKVSTELPTVETEKPLSTEKITALVIPSKPRNTERKPNKNSVEKKEKSQNLSDQADGSKADTVTTNRRKRTAANPLYHWSSSSEDESQDLIEVKPIRDELEDEEDRPIQHGWIVGDSPKKLVTMLAQAKGKKTDIDCVKEQGKRRTNAVS